MQVIILICPTQLMCGTIQHQRVLAKIWYQKMFFFNYYRTLDQVPIPEQTPEMKQASILKEWSASYTRCIHTLSRRGCLCEDNTVLFFSPRSMYRAPMRVVSCRAVPIWSGQTMIAMTNCVQFVLLFVLFLSKICHNKPTTKNCHLSNFVQKTRQN